MSRYYVTLRWLGRDLCLETIATSAEEAVAIILDLHQLAPRSALVSVVCKRFAH